jgi:hypothetical protein
MMCDEEMKLGRWMEGSGCVLQAGIDTGPADLARWDQMLTNGKMIIILQPGIHHKQLAKIIHCNGRENV